MSTYKVNTMPNSDWHVWLTGGFGAFIFDVTMNHSKVFQSLTELVQNAGF